jgi:hypothetical protein
MMMALNGKRVYLTRLRNASLPELLHRVMELYFLWRMRNGADRVTRSLKALADDRFEIEDLTLPTLRAMAANDLLTVLNAGRTFNLNAPGADIDRFEETWKNAFFSDVKQTNAVDIRAVWERARLQHLTVLLAHLSSGPDEGSGDAAGFVRDAVLNWIRNNPFLFGPHYASAMECGLRIPVFCYCFQRLRTLSGAERASIGAAVFEHGWLISKRLSLYSSLGNHTIAESVGLIFAGGAFRSTPEGKEWIGTGINLLNQELHHQILDDGGAAEQSFNYHRFVLDLYWLAIDFLEKNGLHDCGSWKSRLTQGEEFLVSFDCGGRPPAIGDSDDGYAVAPGVAPSRPYVAKILDRIRTFSASGYTILRTSTDASLVFDHGPIGMAPLYNHGHADALAILVSKKGEEILIDPGTYRYNGEPEWRRYFKSTRAHNTVTIDGLDQAVQETGFIWSRPYKAKLLRTSDEAGSVMIEAGHNGYTRLKNPVAFHKRTVLLLDGKDFLIRDTFSGKGDHRFEINFHVHPDVCIRKEDSWLRIQKGEAEISLMLLGDDDFEIVRGQESSPFGWYSPAYGVKVKSSVLTCTRKGRPNEVSFSTVICSGGYRPDLGRLEDMAWHM